MVNKKDLTLRQRLEAKHLTPLSLAKAAACTKRYVNAILAGEKEPSPALAKKLAAHSKRAFKWTDFYD